MTRLSARKGVTVSGLVLLALLAPCQPGQAAAVIRHTPGERLPNNAHPEISAILESEDRLATAKLFFRAGGEAGFHYVEMGPGATPGTVRAVLPIPEAGTSLIEYYIVAGADGKDEAWTKMYRAATTSEPVPETTHRGATPEIWIGKVGGSGPDLPVGFQLVGVAGILRATGEPPVPAERVEPPRATVADTTESEGLGISDEMTYEVPSEDGEDRGGVPWGPVTAVGALAATGAGVAVLTGSEATAPVPDTRDALSACFTVSPTVISQGGSVQLNAGCSSPQDAISRYRWDLGNGEIMEGARVTATYRESGNFQILLTVSNAVESNTASRRIEVLEGPPPLRACITTDPLNGRIDVGDAIRFDASCSQPDGGITSYQWNLGDGRVRDGRVVSANYSEPGDYVVSLTVGDGAETNTTTMEVKVEVGEDLNACFVTSKETALEGALIELDASCSTPTGQIVSYEWDLGDGTQATGRVITKSWETADTYVIKLTVSDGKDFDSTMVDFLVEPDLIVACFDIADSGNPGRAFGVNQTADFDAGCSVGRDLDYDWDFGDGTTITGGNRQESHSFSTPATYTVTLFVSGRQSTTQITKQVEVLPKRDLSVDSVSPPIPPDPFNPIKTFNIATSGTSDKPGNDDIPVQLVFTISGGPAVIIQSASAAGGSCSIQFRQATCNWAPPHPAAANVQIVVQLIFFATQPYLVTASISSSAPIIDDPGNNFGSVAFSFPLRTDVTTATATQTSFSSLLEVGTPDGSMRGRVTLNEAMSQETDNSMPFRHQGKGKVGENRIQATRLTPGVPGQWRFDFSETPDFEPGSLTVVAGQVISRGPRLLVLRTSGTPGEAIELTYRISPSSEGR